MAIHTANFLEISDCFHCLHESTQHNTVLSFRYKYIVTGELSLCVWLLQLLLSWCCHDHDSWTKLGILIGILFLLRFQLGPTGYIKAFFLFRKDRLHFWQGSANLIWFSVQCISCANTNITEFCFKKKYILSNICIWVIN